MNLNEVIFTDAVPIDGYGPGFFRVGGQILEGAAIIHAKGAKGWGGYDDIQALLDLKGQIDVILLGTGKSMTPVPASLREPLDEAGIGIEPMASPTACRTYNVLVSEGRRVAVAALPVGE